MVNNNPDEIYFFKIALAKKKIEVECISRHVLYGFRGYLASFDEPDLTISVSSKEICEEAIKTYGHKIVDDNLDERIAVEYVQVESRLIMRKIADAFIDFNIILLHGAAIAVDGKCFIFTAESGTGKTTHINNWLSTKPGTIVVNGDKPFLDVETGLVYGSPWCGKEGMNTNISVPLAGIIALERGESNSIQEISFKNILPTLLQQTYIPASGSSLKGYQLLARLSNIPCYKLSCNMDRESAIVAYRGLFG